MFDRNRIVTVARDQQVIEGIRKNFKDVGLLLVGGKGRAPDSAEALLQSRIDGAARIAAAKAAWLEAIREYEAIDAECDLVVRDLRRVAIGAFGEDSPRLADFGFAAPRRAELTPEQKAIAVEKRAATRKARGTMGPKARLAIKGVVAAAAEGRAVVAPPPPEAMVPVGMPVRGPGTLQV